jgi:hypothetical protein
MIHDYIGLLGHFAVDHGFALDVELDDFVM